MKSRTDLFTWGAVALLVAVALALAWDAGRGNSPTMDEPYHLMAAASYVREGVYDLNPEHPPLAKLVAGAALAPLDLRVSERPPVARLPFLYGEVRGFLYDNRVDDKSILSAGRLPFLALFAALILLTAAWGLELGGTWGGLLAAGFVALLPLFLGHATVVHTDLMAALAFTAVFFAFSRALERPRWFAGFSLLLGLALAAKFSALYLLPFTAVLLLLEMRRRRRLLVREALLWAGALAGAFVVLSAVYAVPLRNMDGGAQRAALRGHLSKMRVGEGAIRAVERLSSVSRPLAHYAAGVLYVEKINKTGQGINTFMGENRVKGFPLYFPAAFLMKTPLLFLMHLWAAGFGRRWAAGDWMLMTPVLLYFLVSVGSSYNIGVRHLSPIFPLLALWAARRVKDWRAAPAVAGLFLAGALASALWARPHFISDFNLLFDRRPERFLADSNLDWGQDWDRAAAFAGTRGWGDRPVVVVYHGTARPERAFARGVLWDDAPSYPPGAIFAVSVQTLMTGPDFLAVFGYKDESARLRALLGGLRGGGFTPVPCTRAVRFFVPVDGEEPSAMLYSE
jgi:hypothetical protein